MSLNSKPFGHFILNSQPYFKDLHGIRSEITPYILEDNSCDCCGYDLEPLDEFEDLLVLFAHEELSPTPYSAHYLVCKFCHFALGKECFFKQFMDRHNSTLIPTVKEPEE